MRLPLGWKSTVWILGLWFALCAAHANAQIRFVETGGTQTEYVGFSPPSSISTNLMWTLPASDGSANQCLATNGSGTLQWVTAGDSSPTVATKSANFTVGTGENNYLYLVSAAATATLPSLASVSNGFQITVKRTGAGTVVIDGSGSETIDGTLTRIMASSSSSHPRRRG